VAQEVVKEFAYEHNVQYFECVLDSTGSSGTSEIFTVLVDKIMETHLYAGKQIGGEQWNIMSVINLNLATLAQFMAFLVLCTVLIKEGLTSGPQHILCMLKGNFFYGEAKNF